MKAGASDGVTGWVDGCWVVGWRTELAGASVRRTQGRSGRCSRCLRWSVEAAVAAGGGGRRQISPRKTMAERSSSRSWLPVMGEASGGVGSGSVRCPRYFG
ncbi:hypothetical protein ACLOJK_012751 [Asimina triloba]